MTTTSRAREEVRGLSGRHVLGAMLAFFAVIIVADATMIYKAVSTFGGVDNANAYRDGLAYNARIALAERQAALGWSETVELVSEPARLRVALKDASGAAPASLRVEATLGRPATNAADTVLRLAEVAPGVFEAPVGDDPGPGAWIARVRAYPADGTTAEPIYQMRRRLWVAP
ncbi:FixH family protein [Hyphomicrobium sp.]|uniref:FixH family protein n=1 Tax=Hyphomicrobium sp. TaxID=82 RepID=UPI0025B85844|nr:FixH family protein [Hyphomicrobium sp.]MCC7253851.1 FixH family protein [Hyphomicrobium sp.]